MTTKKQINYDRLSKNQLAAFWCKNQKKLANTSPFTDYEKWAVLQDEKNLIFNSYCNKHWDKAPSPLSRLNRDLRYPQNPIRKKTINPNAAQKESELV